MREAQNINTSLLVLGRCLKSIHEGQLTRTKTDAIGPFRESKLTRLFQQALSGKEHLALIVNVNPLPNLYVETQNVLNFAAIAKRIVIEEKRQIRKKLKSRFSQIVTQSIETVTDWDVTELESADWQQTDAMENASEYVSSEEYMDLTNENERLRKEMAVLKNSALIRDFQSRQEMAEKYIAMINELEVDWKQRINDVESQHEDDLEWTVKQVEKFYKEKLSQMHRKKRRRTDCSDESDEDDDRFDVTVKELSKENTQLRAKNETLKKSLTELKITNETLIVEKNKASFQLGLLKDDLKVARNLLEAAQRDISLNQDGKIYMEEMTSQLLAKEEQIRKLKEFLNEAKGEYISTTSELRRKELCVDEQAKIIIENEEKIEDLELHLEQVNVCLTEKSRIAELLEEKLERQSEKLSDTENKMLLMQGEIDRLINERSALFKSNEKPEVAEDFRHKSEAMGEASRTSAQCEYREIIIKEELITSIEGTAEDFGNIMQNIQEMMKSTRIEDAETQSNLEPREASEMPLPKENFEYFESPALSRTDVVNNVEKKEICCKSTQTAATTTTIEDIRTSCRNQVSSKEEAIQTASETLNSDDKVKLEELTTRYDNVHVQYEQECLKVKQLTEELGDMRKTMQSLKEENHSIKIIMDEYKRSAEIFEKQLSLATEDKRKMKETLLSSNVTLEKKIEDYEREIDQLGKHLSAAKTDAQCYLKDLQTTRKELDDLSKRKREKEVNAPESDEFASIKKEDNASDTSVKRLDERADETEVNLEVSLMAKLKNDIVELNENLEACRIEKSCIQNALDENNKKLLELENRLEDVVLREQEKDTEIATLQKELKHMIQGRENSKKSDDLIEAKLKHTISELTQTKEMLSQKEQYIKELRIHLENFERNAKIFNLLEENAKERQVENERLRNVNDELRTNLAHKEREMDAFMKNRDETVTKYEGLVKNQQEELDMQKREVMRYQELFRRQVTPTPNKDDYKRLQNRIQYLQDKLCKYEAGAKAKDYCDTTSEDEVLAQRQPKRRGKKTILSAKQEDIPIIELSGSESKRSTRRTALPAPPPAESSTEKKRTTRRKKLFVANDSFADIEPENVVPSTPLPPITRNLRNRKK